MAKIIKYNLCTKVNHGTVEKPVLEDVLTEVVMGWNEINEAIAQREAYNGEYTVEDDGQGETAAPSEGEDTEVSELKARVQLLEQQLAAYEEAYNEGVNEA